MNVCLCIVFANISGLFFARHANSSKIGLASVCVLVCDLLKNMMFRSLLTEKAL